MICVSQHGISNFFFNVLIFTLKLPVKLHNLLIHVYAEIICTASLFLKYLLLIGICGLQLAV